MKTTESLLSLKKHCLPVYAPAPFVLDHGKGSRLWDRSGREYVDLGSGIGVNILGHQHPALLKSLMEQAQKLWHVSNWFYSEPALSLSEDLTALSFADHVFLSNSGAEANEAAIKLARKYASISHSDPNKREIITFKGSFHGRTLTTVTATAQPKYQKGYEPLPGGFTYVPFNDFSAIEDAISEKTCAVMIEPIQGEGGIHVVAPGFLTHLRTLCDQHDALLIYDEIQSGLGRSGKLFAYQWEADCTPDIMTLAKALAGGLPIGAMLTTQNIGSIFKPGDHGTTFGGNPVVTAVARTVLQEIQSQGFMEHVCAQRALLLQHLNDLNDEFQIFSEIRGRGLMVGAELKGAFASKAMELVTLCQKHGVLILVAGSNVLRFLPPLNITQEELQEGFKRLRLALIDFQKRT